MLDGQRILSGHNQVTGVALDRALRFISVRSRMRRYRRSEVRPAPAECWALPARCSELVFRCRATHSAGSDNAEAELSLSLASSVRRYLELDGLSLMYRPIPTHTRKS